MVQQQRGPCARRDAAGDQRDPSEVAADVSHVGAKEGAKQVLWQEAAPPRTVGHVEAADRKQVPSVVPVEVGTHRLSDEAGRACWRGEVGVTVGHSRRREVNGVERVCVPRSDFRGCVTTYTYTADARVA